VARKVNRIYHRTIQTVEQKVRAGNAGGLPFPSFHNHCAQHLPNLDTASAIKVEIQNNPF